MKSIYTTQSAFFQYKIFLSQQALLRLRMPNFFLLGILIIFPYVSMAQTEIPSEPILVHELVGYRITQDEFVNYKVSKLLQIRSKDFAYAEIFQSGAGTYKMFVHLKGAVVMTRSLVKPQLSALRLEIEKEGRELLQVFLLMQAAYMEGEIVKFKIRTRDNRNISGKWIEDIGESLIIESEGVKIGLPKEDIREVFFEGRRYHAGYVLVTENPIPDRYIWSPSAIPIAKECGYYQLKGFTYMGANMRISNHVSASVEVDFLTPLLLNAFLEIWFDENVIKGVISQGNIRMGIPVKENWHLGAGLDALSLPSLDGGQAFRTLMPYVIATRGNKNNNLSLRSGLLLSNYEELEYGYYVEMSGIRGTDSNLALVTENRINILRNDLPSLLISRGGIRLWGKKMAVDVGGILAGFVDIGGVRGNQLFNDLTDSPFGTFSGGLYVVTRRFF